MSTISGQPQSELVTGWTKEGPKSNKVQKMAVRERGAVEGYPDRSSAMPGELVGLCCAGRGRFSVEVARLGATREVVWRRDDLEAIDYPVPDDAAQNGCGWPVTVEVAVGDDCARAATSSI